MLSLVVRQFEPRLRSYQKRLFSCAMSRTALLLLANGAEEMEAVIAADVLRRGGVSNLHDIAFCLVATVIRTLDEMS